jgi:hypothetical protein
MTMQPKGHIAAYARPPHPCHPAGVLRVCPVCQSHFVITARGGSWLGGLLTGKPLWWCRQCKGKFRQ